MVECEVLHHKLLRLLLNSLLWRCCVSIRQFSPFSPTSGCRLDLEFRALFRASADFGYFRRGAQSVLFRAVSGSFIRPVLLSNHVSSQDQKGVCGLLELLVPCHVWKFALHAPLSSPGEVRASSPLSKLQCRDGL